jgi:hypothetical protein
MQEIVMVAYVVVEIGDGRLRLHELFVNMRRDVEVMIMSVVADEPDPQHPARPLGLPLNRGSKQDFRFGIDAFLIESGNPCRLHSISTEQLHKRLRLACRRPSEIRYASAPHL